MASLLPSHRRRLVGVIVVAGLGLYWAAGDQVDRAGAAQGTAPSARAGGIDRAELTRVVRTLAAPQFEGRATGSHGGNAARRFVRDAFAAIGLSPGAAAGQFLQPFTFVHSGAPPGRPWKTTYSDAANVLGVQPGTRSDGRTIVISAHYDHVGIRDGVLYPGADDNASGIAALLALARYLRERPLQHRVVFAAFDAEELGLEGAKAFLRAPPVPVSAIALNVNLDMVSRNDRNEIVAAGTSHTPALKPIVEEVQRRSAVRIVLGHDRPTRGGMTDDWTLQSDHGVFHQAGIPFFYFGVENHPDYHKPTDTADKINPKFFGDVVDMLADVVLTADRHLR